VAYFVWTGDIRSIDDSIVFDDMAWLTGGKLPKKRPTLTFKRTRQKPVGLPDVISIKFGCLILSPKAMGVLDGVGATNLEYVPVRIRAKTGAAVETTHCMVNVVGRVACLDREHGDVGTFHGSDKVSHLYRYRLVDAKLPKKPLPVFRLGEFTYHTLASAEVKAACEAAKLKGSRFVATESYNGYT